MRLWSIHPKYLDRQGLLAVWREGLLAKKVLEDNTKGYKNHPQLDRFKKTENPIKYIQAYLCWILKEAKNRGYNFDVKKVEECLLENQMTVTDRQLEYEFEHLKKKLKIRDKDKLAKNLLNNKIQAHPLFCITKGNIEDWEKIKY